MYDYLGTFTKSQLLERNSFLQAQIYSLPEVIKTLEIQRDSLGVSITKDNAETFNITSEVLGKTYNLGSVTVPTFNSGTALERLTQGAIKSRYPLRMDPLTNIISHGDSIWRASPKIMSTKDLQNDQMDNIPDDDSVPSYRSLKLLQSFRGVSKRQEAIEGKVQKLRYRYLRLQDEIDNKKGMLSNFQNELTDLVKMLNDRVEIVSKDGKTTHVTSDYKSAGVDYKTDVTSQEDVTRLYDLFLPSISNTDEDTDQTTVQILPSNPKDQVSTNLPGDWKPGNISVMLKRFPLVRNVTDTRSLQLIANVYEYGFKKNIMVSFPDSTSLVRSIIGKGAETDHRYLPPNVAKSLIDYAQDVYNVYGIKFVVTEAWPPTTMHGSGGHDTGNCVDLVLSIVHKTKTIEGITLPDLAQRIIDYGVKKSYIQSGYNEYAKESSHKTGPHIHLNFHCKYFNEGKLFKA